MDELLLEYLPILFFIGIAIVMAGMFVVAAFVVARQRPDSEKVSSYECGFEPFDDARGRFDVRFYLVVSLGQIGEFGFWSMVVFLGLLTIGFIYEWKKGALEWE
jgi:NADH-quinone oxidoreductase subunit A